MQRPKPETVTLNDILITEELSQRSPRLPNLQAENQAMRSLARQMARDSQSLMQTLADTALELCQAGTAGVSLLETTANDEEIFRWNVLAGTLADHVGVTTPRNFSPCGVCLAQGTPVLFSHPEYYFTYFQEANTPVVEGLVLPLVADHHILGTIWIMSHDEQRQFDAEDVRIMTSLADFTATALLLNQQQTKELLAVNVTLETEVAERKQAEEQSRALISNLPGGAAFVVDRNLRYLLAEGEALAIAGFKPEDFVGRTIFEVLPSELAANYEPLYRQTLAGEPFEHEHHAHDRTYISRGTPLRSADGEIYGVLAVSYDISDRKKAEEFLRESEAKYRSLFGSIDEGYALCELLYDDTGKAIDWRLLEVNPAFERLTGLVDAAGKTAAELNPNLGSAWIEIFNNVAQTGEPAHFEHYIRSVDYWLDLHALRLDGDSRHLVIVFNDITDRKRTEETLAADLQDTKLLHDLSARLVTEDDIQAIYQEIVATAIALTRADAGSIQILDEATQELVMLANQGAGQKLTEHFHRVNAGSNTSCGEALRAGKRTFINFDVPESEDPHGSMRLHREEGYLSAQSTPLIARSGKAIGMVSTHWCKHHRPSDRELRFLDLLVRQAADLIEQRQAEAALRASEAKYRALFELIDDAFCIIEMIFDEVGKPIDFLYLETNQAFVKHAGQPMAGKRIREIVPNIEQFWLDNYGRVAKTGEVVHLEHIVQGLGDQWFQTSAFRLGGEGNQRVAVLFRNITDRKRAEAQLRRVAELDAFRVTLSDALRSLSDPIQIQAEACRILGEQLGVDRACYAQVNEAENYIRINQNYLRGDSPSLAGTLSLTDYGWVFPYLRRGETVVVADVENSDMVPVGDRAAMATIKVAAHISLPLIKGDALVGALSVTEPAPRQWSEIDIELVRETAERIWAAIERAYAEAALRESEIQRIQEQSALEEERQRAETLAELDRAKTIFFSNVSHEFRTPLTLMLAPLQDALSDCTLSTAHRESLELAHRNSLRLLKLVNTLLDFSRIEAGRMEAVYEPTDLAQFTADLASVFRSAIERAGLRLIVDCPSLPKPVYVDREMWEKIVLNLLSNAFKFTFEGEITLSIRAESHVVLEVRDTGVGIPSDGLPHLFERFYQVRGTQARTYEGSGIGLALVNELVRLHGGTIDVSSTVGQGTCFTIALPFGTHHLPSDRLQPEGDRIQPIRTLTSTAIDAALYVKAAQQLLEEDTQTREHADTENVTVSPSPRLSFSASPTCVLLVDDNADMREYLTRVLSKHVQVEAVANGAAALAAIEARVPDLVLSDVMMPGLDGFGLLQALRSNPHTREVPIILLSARAGEEAIVEGLESGADDYLIKPFSAQELVSRVNAHLQMAQLRGEALDQARTTIRKKDELLSTVSHELNTPLVSILGWTRLLRTSPPSPAMLTKALDTIERNATLQAKLVQDLLDISRITTGKLRLQLQPVKLATVTETAIASIHHLAEAKGINLVSGDTGQGQAVDVVVMGDGDRLQQVISNLLTNAIKFTPKGGRVEVQLITHAISQSADYAEIRVTDTGIGIAADFLPHAFDRFRQARDSDSENGLGLGLAIAHHLVELHNGTIHAESAGEGQGTTLIIRLPLLTSMPPEQST